MSGDHDLLDDEGAGYLISVADMMSGLLLIFIITLVAFILNFQDAVQKQKKVTETQKEIVRKITNAEQIRSTLLITIKTRLEQNNIIVEIDTEHGVLRLTEQAVLFESGAESLDDDNKNNLKIIGQVLSELVPCYSATPPTGDTCGEYKSYKGKVDSIFIEGHTDNVPINSWRMEDNWVLSAKRAITAYRELVPNTILADIQNISGQPVFSVSGYGEGRPVEGHSYSVPTSDPVNRRIDMRFIMTPPTLTEIQRQLVDKGTR
jgi:flagellar motor protein MotB